MSFKKPFRAVPLNIPVDRRRKRPKVARYLGFAALAGTSVGIISTGATPEIGAAFSSARDVVTTSDKTGARRTNVYYPGCNAARAAGVAPLYRGEPGYRPEMDGDKDGIACEPYRY